MISRFRVAVLVASIALITSCDSNEKSTLCFLTAVESVSPVETFSQAFTYSSYRPATWVRTFPTGETRSAVFLYDIVGVLYRLNIEHGTGSGRIDYAYDAMGRLLTEEGVNAPDSYKIHYVYNSNSQLVNSYYVVSDDTTQIKTYSYPDIVTRNPSTIETLDAGLGTTTHTYTYDDKIYPMRGLLPSEHRINNILSDTMVGGATETFSYQYNGAGYPVSVAGNGTTQSFAYDCQEI